MPTQTGDLLTVTEVQEAALEHSQSVEDNPSGVVEQAIRDAQSDIESYLHQPVMPHEHRQVVGEYDWSEDKTADGLDAQYLAWAEHQPVVEVKEPSDVGIFIRSDRLTHDHPDALRVTYVAGWRRSDQGAGDFSLTSSDIPELPDVIRRVGINLTLMELARGEHGPAIGQVTQAVGAGQQSTVEGIDSGFRQRQLSRLDRFRNDSF